MSHISWEEASSRSDYDYVLIGSGFAALAFADETLRLDPTRRILCLERGSNQILSHRNKYPSHVQSLAKVTQGFETGIAQEYPWTSSGVPSSSSTFGVCSGSYHLYGGKSSFWYGWILEPSIHQLRKFPKALSDATASSIFWKRARELLNVKDVEQLKGQFFQGLQQKFTKILGAAISRVPSLVATKSASFSVEQYGEQAFDRLSVVSLFESLSKRIARYARSDRLAGSLDIVLGCHVERMLTSHNDGCVHAIDTSQGTLTLRGPDARIILCAGAIPNATLLLNSFNSVRPSIGESITGHFITHVYSRVPVACIDPELKSLLRDEHKDWGVTAHVVSGEHPQTRRQYHIQLTSFYFPIDDIDYEQMISLSPSFGTAPSREQTENTHDHIMIICSTLGELSEDNPRSWLQLNQSSDITSNVTLQFTFSENDKMLWDMMDQATFKVLGQITQSPSQIDYWDSKSQAWVPQPPDEEARRLPYIVHEASFTRTGPDERNDTLDELCRPRGYRNVFVTGSSIFPTAGSWNPTLTIVGFTQELARTLAKSCGESYTCKADKA